MRTFLAIDLPGTIRDGLCEVAARLRGCCDGWRWLRRDALHVTVRFLGDVDAADIARHAATWQRAADAASPMRLDVGGAGVFPPRGRPRALWVGVRETSGGNVLLGLAREVESAARELGFAPESRPFRPHVTVARALRGRQADAPPRAPVREVGSFEATEVTLFRSELRPDGARYQPLRAFHLGGT